MICMHTLTHKPPASKHTPNIWKAERLVGQISFSKSKRSLRTQKGSDANASSETHASLAFLVVFFPCSAGETGIFNDISVCEAVSMKTKLSHSHTTATGPQQHTGISETGHNLNQHNAHLLPPPVQMER